MAARVIMIRTYAVWLCRYALILAASLATPAFAERDISDIRTLFAEVYVAAERGSWSEFEALSKPEQQQLRNYVLWPDLRAAYLRRHVATADRVEISGFLDTYGALRPARSLRYRYALHLARSGDLDAFHTLYQQFYRGLGIAKLDCLALKAEIAAGRIQKVVNRALDLWLVSSSQVADCDPVFARLEQEKILGEAHYRQRYALAVDDRELTRARWLAKSIDKAHENEAARWLQAQSRPEKFLRGHARLPDTEVSREQLVYAAERLTYRDPERAAELWSAVAPAYAFTTAQRNATARHIALWTARDRLPGADAVLAKLPADAQDDEVRRWRARVSLREQDWSVLLTNIEQMSDSEQASDQWRYWRGVAFARSGQTHTASTMFAELAAERSYYGFLAADEIGQPYRFDHTEIAADEALIVELANNANLVRARELFRVGLTSHGRSEWDEAVRGLLPDAKRQAAILAHRWGWHSRAIAGVASVGDYDDLAVRYPLPYADAFRQHAEAAQIPPPWAYGVARSESLFMSDVRSSAGAIGLMQLMPATGRSVARRLRVPYAGLDTLTDPATNIRLGTSYLGEMTERYSGNRVLATAAYNAGPHRVDRWLPESGAIDARIWIENIPFNETRKYVRRVLAAETIFYWRLTGEARRLLDVLPYVEAPVPTQLAQRSR